MAFVLELNPALEHIDQLKSRAVPVRLAGKIFRRRPDDVGIDLPGGGLLDTEIAVLKECAQAALENSPFGMCGDKILSGHGDSIRV